MEGLYAVKRRKWWFIGLAVALLAACVGVWKWEERPPYKFLEGVRLSFVEAPMGSPTSRLTYITDRPFEEMRAAARRDPGGVWASIPAMLGTSP